MKHFIVLLLAITIFFAIASFASSNSAQPTSTLQPTRSAQPNNAEDCGCRASCMGGKQCAIKCPEGKAAHCECEGGGPPFPQEAKCSCR